MDGRSMRILILGMLIGGLAGALVLGGAAAYASFAQLAAASPQCDGPACGAAGRPAARGHDLMPAPVRLVQEQTPGLNPKEFIPLPHNGNGPGPGPQPLVPGAGGAQDCDRVLYFYQGRLYQLRPGPTPRNGGNPEFFFMQPYEGPQIPGFPAPMVPGAPYPEQQPLPPVMRF